jgi:hypothetical protein
MESDYSADTSGEGGEKHLSSIILQFIPRLHLCIHFSPWTGPGLVDCSANRMCVLSLRYWQLVDIFPQDLYKCMGKLGGGV